MPYSAEAGKEWTLEKIREMVDLTDPFAVIMDVGPGAGRYAELIRSAPELESVALVGVEVWKPYISRFNLTEKYDNVINQDIRFFEVFSVNLVILGDVLEHMSYEDAQKVWNKVKSNAGAAIISIPVVHWPQGAAEGNPFEEHVTHYESPEEVIAAFGKPTEYKIFDNVGVFVYRFESNGY